MIEARIVNSESLQDLSENQKEAFKLAEEIRKLCQGKGVVDILSALSTAKANVVGVSNLTREDLIKTHEAELIASEELKKKKSEGKDIKIVSQDLKNLSIKVVSLLCSSGIDSKEYLIALAMCKLSLLSTFHKENMLNCEVNTALEDTFRVEREMLEGLNEKFEH